MQIVEMPIGKLKPYENNPRDNDSAVGAVAASIEEFGFKVPIIIDKNNVIVAGHTRLKAAEKLGLAKRFRTAKQQADRLLKLLEAEKTSGEIYRAAEELANSVR